MFKQPTDLSAQQSLLSSLDRQLLSEARQACKGPEQGITLEELQAAFHAKKGTSGFSSFFPVGYRGIVHPPSDGEGTERTWV